MTEIQIKSVQAPFTRPVLLTVAFGLVLRATAVGLLADRERIDRLDLELLRDIASAAAAAGIGQQTAMRILAGATPLQLGRLIEQLDEAIVASPLPDRELGELRRTFELDELARLLGVSIVSLRRYISGSRTTPDVIAERAHWLALVVGDLAGSYNSVGVRRWFERSRPQLDGRSPRDVLGTDWSVDAAAVEQVRGLAAALVESAVAT